MVKFPCNSCWLKVFLITIIIFASPVLGEKEGGEEKKKPLDKKKYADGKLFADNIQKLMISDKPILHNYLT